MSIICHPHLKALASSLWSNQYSGGEDKETEKSNDAIKPGRVNNWVKSASLNQVLEMQKHDVEEMKESEGHLAGEETAFDDNIKKENQKRSEIDWSIASGKFRACAGVTLPAGSSFGIEAIVDSLNGENLKRAKGPRSLD